MKKRLYWLFKTEPKEYSYVDLANNKYNGRWDGVRNYQARNYLRDSIKMGDLVLIYHSSIKIPAVVGVGKIKSEPYPDPTQFDSKSYYFDSKARKDKVRWISLDLMAVKKLEREVNLLDIRSNPKLKEMVLLRKGSRLSIQPVTEANFKIILDMGSK